MPSLAQMFSLVNQKSLYSRSDVEIYAALEEGGFNVYSAVLKEFRGTFLKVDETTLTMVPGTLEYSLPLDFSQLIHLAERRSASENWHPIMPEGLSDALTNVQQSMGWGESGFNYGEQSQFRFYGPYMTAADVGAQGQKIRFSPAATESKFIQIAYAAKWLPIVNANSVVMLFSEGTYAMQNFAIAEAIRSNDDTLSREYEVKAEKALTRFLDWLRVNQIMQRPQIKPYLG